jgi:hypothetical protein
MTFATTTDVLQSINPLAQTQEKKAKDLLHICCSRIPHDNKQTIHQQRCFSSGGGKKRETPTQKNKNCNLSLLHQSIKEGSNQNHKKNKKKESRTPKHITLNNPQLEIDKPQAKNNDDNDNKAWRHKPKRRNHQKHNYYINYYYYYYYYYYYSAKKKCSHQQQHHHTTTTTTTSSPSSSSSSTTTTTKDKNGNLEKATTVNSMQHTRLLLIFLFLFWVGLGTWETAPEI